MQIYNLFPTVWNTYEIQYDNEIQNRRFSCEQQNLTITKRQLTLSQFIVFWFHQFSNCDASWKYSNFLQQNFTETFSYLSSMLHIGLSIKQQTDYLVSSLKARQCQCRISVGLDLSVDVTTHIEKKFDSSGVTVHGSQH